MIRSRRSVDWQHSLCRYGVFSLPRRCLPPSRFRLYAGSRVASGRPLLVESAANLNRSSTLVSARRLYHSLRHRFARSADQFGRWCDERTADAYRFRRPSGQRFVQARFQNAGSLAHVLKLLPRLDAVRLTGPAGRAVWVGDTLLNGELEHLLFPSGAAAQRLGRVPAWGVRRFVREHIEASDVVVSALPRAWPRIWKPRGPTAFTCPIFVNVVLDITEPLHSLVRQGSRKGLRRDFNKIQREGYVWRLSSESSELEWFHAEMYVPHVTRRHGPRALITPLEEWTRWIARGGSLLLLERDKHLVAGMTVRTDGVTCVLGEEGMLETVESADAGYGIQLALKCAGIEFAQSRGMTALVMGRSLARLSDTVLVNKLRWGPRLGPSGRSLHPEWTFVVSRPGSPWCAYLNQQGLIAFPDEWPCVVSIGEPAEDERRAAARLGRMLVVGPGGVSRVESLEP